MRKRHLPRLCHACQAPMARQEDACWRCGSRWQAEAEPQRPAPGRSAEMRPPSVRLDTGQRAAARLRADIDRWADEGGRVAQPVGGT